MANGKKKGNSFERVVAKDLSIWLSQGKEDFCVQRDSSSGGAFKKRDTRIKRSGDLYAADHYAKFFFDAFSVELKAYKDVKPDLWNFVTEKPSKFDEFIKQAKDDADGMNMEFILIVKTNNYSILCVSNSKKLRQLLKRPINLNRDNLFIFTYEKLLSIDIDKLKQSLQ